MESNEIQTLIVNV